VGSLESVRSRCRFLYSRDVCFYEYLLLSFDRFALVCSEYSLCLTIPAPASADGNWAHWRGPTGATRGRRLPPVSRTLERLGKPAFWKVPVAGVSVSWSRGVWERFVILIVVSAISGFRRCHSHGIEFRFLCFNELARPAKEIVRACGPSRHSAPGRTRQRVRLASPCHRRAKHRLHFVRFREGCILLHDGGAMLGLGKRN